MAHTVEKLPNEPIVIVTYQEPFSIKDEIPAIKEDLENLAGQIEGHMFDIHEATNLKLDFSKIVQALGTAFSRTKKPAHLDRLTTIGVGSGPLFSLAEMASKQDQYGNYNIKILPTLEEALSFARSQTAKAEDQ